MSDDLKAYIETAKVVKDNIQTISLGGFVALGSIVVSFLKLHKKIITEPRDKIQAATSANSNRLKEFDTIIEQHDKRIESLENEDKSVIATIQSHTSQLEIFKQRLQNNESKHNELKDTLTELRRLDSERQQALGKVQGILEYMLKS